MANHLINRQRVFLFFFDYRDSFVDRTFRLEFLFSRHFFSTLVLHLLVEIEWGAMFKRHIASFYVAPIWVVIVVKILMLDQVLFLAKTFTADWALELLKTQMNSLHMPLEWELGAKSFFTEGMLTYELRLFPDQLFRNLSRCLCWLTG